MKLTNRVSLFFLAVLAIVLVIYSLMFYSAARRHIEYQFTGELRGVLNSLVAAAEIEETEVKWQPLEHSLAMGSTEFGGLEWIVIGDRHLVAGRSPGATDSFTAWALALASDDLPGGTLVSHFDAQQQRQYYSQRLLAPRPGTIKHQLDEFDEILVTVGRSTAARDALLNRLALLVTILPLLTWSLAAVLGRWIVGRAILPLSKMARQAQSITDFQSRLVLSDSGDELSELGAAFNRLLDRQQIAIQQQQRFAGDAAHELRTPLTALLGQIDVALRRPREASEYAATLNQLRLQAGSLHEIVESLLFLARTEADSGAPHVEAIDLRDWMDKHRQHWTDWSRAEDLRVDDRLEGDVTVLATPSLLSRVVDNLVSNACKYSDPGTPIVITLQADQGQVAITVRDSGPGIAPEDVPHLFEPFFRSAAARRAGKPGTGLGLAIASRIASTLGGTLQCRGEPGVGSQFILRLPLKAGSRQEISR